MMLLNVSRSFLQLLAYLYLNAGLQLFSTHRALNGLTGYFAFAVACLGASALLFLLFTQI
jgi:hypothetical protein